MSSFSYGNVSTFEVLLLVLSNSKVEDDPQPRWPSTSTDDTHIQKIKELMRTAL